MSAMTQPSQPPQNKNNEKKIRSSHGANDTQITLYLPPTYRRYISLEDLGMPLLSQDENLRFKQEINKHINDENFLETDIGKNLERKIKQEMIENGWLYMGYHSGAFYGFDCIKPYHCCMRHIKTRPFWKDMPDIKITKIVICAPDTVGRKSIHPLYGGRDFILVGNNCNSGAIHRETLKPNTRLQVCPKEYRTTIWEGINAPAEFTIEYDKDGKPIFNKYDFAEYLAQIMKTIIDEEVQRRVGPIVPSTRVETVTNPEDEENIPVATEVIALNEHEATV